MRRLIPSAPEIMIFVGLAVLCAAIAEHMATAGNRDAGLSFMSAPLFVFAAVMGLRRNWAQDAEDVVDAAVNRLVSAETVTVEATTSTPNRDETLTAE